MVRTGSHEAAQFSSLSRELQSAALSFGSLTASAATFYQVIDAFRELEKQLILTNSVAGGTVAQINQMEKSVRDFALAAQFSATEAANSLYFLASAGFAVEESIEAMSGVLLLAQSTLRPAAEASDILASNIRAFGLEAKDASRISNVLVATISASQATMEKLGFAFRQAAPVARVANLEIERTSAALGVLFNIGLRGEQAGTALRNVIVRLAKPVGEAADLLAHLAIKTVDVTGRMRDLQDILTDLRKRGLSEADLTTIFGVEALAGSIALIDSTAGSWSALEEKVTGTQKAFRIAQDQMNTFNGELRLFTNALTEAGIVLGGQIAPYLSIVINSFTDLIVEFRSLSVGSQQWISDMLLMGAGTLAFVAAISSLIVVFRGIASTIGPTLIGFGAFIGLSGKALKGAPSKVGSMFETIAIAALLFRDAIAKALKALAGFVVGMKAVVTGGTAVAGSMIALRAAVAPMLATVTGIVAAMGGWPVVIGVTVAALFGLSAAISAVNAQMDQLRFQADNFGTGPLEEIQNFAKNASRELRRVSLTFQDTGFGLLDQRNAFRELQQNNQKNIEEIEKSLEFQKQQLLDVEARAEDVGRVADRVEKLVRRRLSGDLTLQREYLKAMEKAIEEGGDPGIVIQGIVDQLRQSGIKDSDLRDLELALTEYTDAPSLIAELIEDAAEGQRVDPADDLNRIFGLLKSILGDEEEIKNNIKDGIREYERQIDSLIDDFQIGADREIGATEKFVDFLSNNIERLNDSVLTMFKSSVETSIKENENVRQALIDFIQSKEGAVDPDKLAAVLREVLLVNGTLTAEAIGRAAEDVTRDINILDKAGKALERSVRQSGVRAAQAGAKPLGAFDEIFNAQVEQFRLQLENARESFGVRIEDAIIKELGTKSIGIPSDKNLIRAISGQDFVIAIIDAAGREVPRQVKVSDIDFLQRRNELLTNYFKEAAAAGVQENVLSYLKTQVGRSDQFLSALLLEMSRNVERVRIQAVRQAIQIERAGEDLIISSQNALLKARQGLVDVQGFDFDVSFDIGAEKFVAEYEQQLRNAERRIEDLRLQGFQDESALQEYFNVVKQAANLRLQVALQAERETLGEQRLAVADEIASYQEDLSAMLSEAELQRNLDIGAPLTIITQNILSGRLQEIGATYDAHIRAIEKEFEAFQNAHDNRPELIEAEREKVEQLIAFYELLKQKEIERAGTANAASEAAIEGLDAQLATLEKNFGKSDELGKGLSAAIIDFQLTAQSGFEQVREGWGNLTADLAEGARVLAFEGGGAFSDFMDQMAIDAAGDIVKNAFESLLNHLLEALLSFEGESGVIFGTIIGGLASIFSGSAGTFAKGGAFYNGLQTFARGAVVSSPTVFPMANGGIGLMGESGDEAILPLKRDSQGRLGVTSEDGVGGMIVNYNWHITTPNADSFNKSRSQIQADAYAGGLSSFNRNR